MTNPPLSALHDLTSRIFALQEVLDQPVPTDSRTAAAHEAARGQRRQQLADLLDQAVPEVLRYARAVIVWGADVPAEVCGAAGVVRLDAGRVYAAVAEMVERHLDGREQPFTPTHWELARVGIRRWVDSSPHAQAAARGHLAHARTRAHVLLNFPQAPTDNARRFRTRDELLVVVRAMLRAETPGDAFAYCCLLDAVREGLQAGTIGRPLPPRLLVVGPASEDEARALAGAFVFTPAVVGPADLPGSVDAEYVELLFDS